MKVIEHINQSSHSEVREEFLKHYSDFENNVLSECWNDFKKNLNSHIIVQRNMIVQITLVQDDFDNSEYIDVSGIDENGEVWALDFTPWSDWLHMEVNDLTGLNLSVSQIAAHLYWEMTFHGNEETAQDRLVNLQDMMKGIEDGTIETVPFDLEEFFKKFDDKD